MMKILQRFLRHLSRSLRAKLFLSHFLATLVGTFTLVTAIYLFAPVLFGRLMSGMMGSMPRMMEPGQMSGMGSMMDSISQVFATTLLYSLLVAGAAAIVGAALISFFVSQRIVGPLRRMVEATRRIVAGRYDERVPVGEADEVGILAEGFNAMTASLQAAEQQRMNLIGDISHELHTPLSTMQGYMTGLIEGVIEPSEETWALLYGETERMRRLVDDLRQLSHAEAGQLDLDVAVISPADVVRAASERMLPLYDEKGVELRNVVPRTLSMVLGDADRVVQVLTNLLSNALRHTPTGGQVSVEATSQADTVAFRVRDTGEGIAPEHLGRVFERFYRTEKSRSRDGGGSGLGLAISRALIEAMGGRIWAESTGPGAGTTVAFTLPVSEHHS